MKRFVCLFVFLVLSLSAFAADNMHIFLKEQGEAITGFKTATLPSEIKITVAYPDKYQEPTSKRFPLVFLFDTKEYKNKHVSQSYYLRMKQELHRFYKDAYRYLETAAEGCEAPEQRTVGDLISTAIDNSCDQWVACSVPLEEYMKHITDAYNILNRLFMNGIRMALLPWSSRNHFCGILQKCCKTPQEVYRSIEFIPCFEPHK